MHQRTLQLHLTERARRGQMLYHATPGLYLILNGVSALLSGHTEHLKIDILGIVAGLALLIVLRHELKSKSHGHSKVAWFEVLVGIVVIIEGYHKLHPGSWVQPGWLLMLVGLMFIALGIFHNQITHLRRLTCTDTGFTLRIRPVRVYSGEWKKIKSFALESTKLVIKHQDNSISKKSLRLIENRIEVLKMLDEELAQASSTS